MFNLVGNIEMIELTLYSARLLMTQDRTASRPSGTVTFLIGSAKSGPVTALLLVSITRLTNRSPIPWLSPDSMAVKAQLTGSASWVPPPPPLLHQQDPNDNIQYFVI